MTRAASLHTYHTVALLVHAGRRDAAYFAYAYFRWVDDSLDGTGSSEADRLAFAGRQQFLIERCYAGDAPALVSPEERMLIHLIRFDPDPQSPLAAYVHNMMSVMAFDALRRGRLISQTELAAYERSLAVAVTEAMYYFIGRGQAAPRAPERYLAVRAAHIAHMLRDTYEDIRAGYFNVPAEFLQQHNISEHEVDAASYRKWVRMRVDLAREYFRLGRRHINSAGGARCRLAANLYAARFEAVLDRIEVDGYRLRPDYGARKTLGAAVKMAGSALRAWVGLDPAGRLVADTGRDGAPGLE